MKLVVMDIDVDLDDLWGAARRGWAAGLRTHGAERPRPLGFYWRRSCRWWGPTPPPVAPRAALRSSGLEVMGSGGGGGSVLYIGHNRVAVFEALGPCGAG